MSGLMNPAGPVVRMCDEVDGIIAAIEDDNPDRPIVVTDQGAYVRIHAAGRLVVTQQTLREYLGESFEIHSLEGLLASFKGRIRTSSDKIEWESGVLEGPDKDGQE